MNDECEYCAECGKRITQGIHRSGKVFCSGHCEIEDWWNDPSVENAVVEV